MNGIEQSADGKASGTIGEDKKGTDGKTIPSVQVVFTNTAHKQIPITVEKKWQDAKGNELTGGLPTSIWVKLQRRRVDSTDGKWTDVPDTEVKLTNGTWKHTFTGMDACDISDTTGTTYYEYRVVESDAENGNYIADGTLQLGDYKYIVASKTKNHNG